MPRVLAALALVAFLSLVAISRLCPDAGPGVGAGPPAPHAAMPGADGPSSELLSTGVDQRWKEWQEAQNREMRGRIEALEARLAAVSPR